MWPTPVSEQTSKRPSHLHLQPVSGEGTGVWVGLHGWGQSREVFAALPVPAGSTLWAGDLFGHGGTPLPLNFDLAADALAEAVAALPGPSAATGLSKDPEVGAGADASGRPAPQDPSLCDARAPSEEPGASGPYVVAYSWGARLALAAWARHPSLWRGATLVGVHPGLRHEAERTARRAHDRQRAERLVRLGAARFFEDWDRQPLFAGRTRSPSGRDRHRTPDLAAAMVRLGLGEMPDLGALLSARVNDGTAQVVVGEHDTKFRRILTPFSPRVVPGCAHDVLSTAPERLGALAATHASHLQS